MATRADIIAEVEAMRLPPRETAVEIALAEFQSGLAVDQICPACGQLLVGTGLPESVPSPRAWAVRCDCGVAVFQGL